MASTSTWYICQKCHHIYKPEEGDLDSGIAPGTRFSDLPEDWTCPVCHATKSQFVPYEAE